MEAHFHILLCRLETESTGLPDVAGLDTCKYYAFYATSNFIRGDLVISSSYKAASVTNSNMNIIE